MAAWSLLPRATIVATGTMRERTSNSKRSHFISTSCSLCRFLLPREAVVVQDCGTVGCPGDYRAALLLPGRSDTGEEVVYAQAIALVVAARPGCERARRQRLVDVDVIPEGYSIG
jgi:hypothetical protein